MPARTATRAFDPAMFAILVVDDEEMNRDMLSRRHERRGYFTLTAAGGAEAIEKIGGTGCDLVLLDVMMPGMSGVEVLQKLRERYEPSELPIVMASARTDTDVITQCLRQGANDYVTKPLDFEVVLARVQTQLTMKAAVEAVRASEGRFRMLAEMSADMISLHAPDGTFRFASAAARDLLELAPEALVGTTFQELVHPKDREAMPPTPGELPEACTMVIRLRRGDDWVWCEVKSRSIKGSRSGKVTDVQMSTRDVSFYVDPRTGLPLTNPPPLPPPVDLPAPLAKAGTEPPVRARKSPP
jgi:PAS domain S-box-containing protein